MARGGARNRSGPQKDPLSGRSERAGWVLTALPVEGYPGEPPEFPLPKQALYDDEGYVEDAATDDRWARELQVWEWAWSTPQACAWSMAPWRWMSVAMWVRTFVVCEGASATAADKNSLHRFADQIGMTPAGLKENGWSIADPAHLHDAPPASGADPDDDEQGTDPRKRFTVVS